MLILEMKKTNYYLNLADAVATGSKCDRLKVGCVIVNPQHRIVSTGYNGTPIGTDNICEDDATYPYVLHAELNAILFAKQDLTGCTLYCTHSCCVHCAACVIQSGISTVVFREYYKYVTGIKFLIKNNVKCYIGSKPILSMMDIHNHT